mgnify:CR=1 FL=1
MTNTEKTIGGVILILVILFFVSMHFFFKALEQAPKVNVAKSVGGFLKEVDQERNK